MGIATGMKELTQDILSSSERRAEELTRIKGETSTLRQEAVDMVRDFSISRGETSRQLRRELAQSNTDRRKEVIQSRKDAQRLIQGFHDSRRESADQLRKELTQGSKLLVQNEKKRKQEVGMMLDAFQGSREETGNELRKDLAEGKVKMKLEVKETLADAKALINSYQSSRRTMGAQLKDDLGKDRDERKSDVEGMRHGFRKAQAEVQADLKTASDAWRGMGSAIRPKTAKSKTMPQTKAKSPAEIAPDLKEKLLSIVNQHVGGITLSEAAETLGLATIALGKAAKVLLEQGKVRKEEKIYFPVTT
jgi:hypothetical protein